MDWHKTSLSELEVLQACALGNGLLANNYSAVNSVLYAGKYQSQTAIEGGWIFEKFRANGICYFAFPHRVCPPGQTSPALTPQDPAPHDSTSHNPVPGPDSSGLHAALAALADDAAERGERLVFGNITLDEKEALTALYPTAEVLPTPEFSDYIYRTQKLADLAGKKLSRKRNHIHQFQNKHPDFAFHILGPQNLDAVWQVEKLWFAENTDCTADPKAGDTGTQRPDGGAPSDLEIEKEIIRFALDSFDSFARSCGMTGGVLSVAGQPVAFCIASILSGNVTDVHFEKCLSPFAADGGYAVINNEFAKSVHTEFINREEDLGIEGLRKAKLSYYPEMVLEKFTVAVHPAKDVGVSEPRHE